VVIHLDLPWTGARLEQRVGRSRRLGASHHCTSVYALAPPASAEAMLRVEARIRAKLRAANRATGIAGTILPGLAPIASDESAARTRERIRTILERWRESPGITLPPSAPGAETCIAACVHTARPVLFLVLREGNGDILPLAALENGELRSEPTVVLDALLVLDGVNASAPLSAAHVAPPPEVIECALQTAQRWIERHRAALATGAALTLHAPARRSALRRISTITAHAPLHRRPALAALAAGARRAVTVPCGAGAESVLGEIARAPMPDEAWLRALAAFGDAHGARQRSAGDPAPCLVALIVGVSGAT